MEKEENLEEGQTQRRSWSRLRARARLHPLPQTCRVKGTTFLRPAPPAFRSASNFSAQRPANELHPFPPRAKVDGTQFQDGPL